MAKDLHKKRNQRLNMARAKTKQLDKGFGIKAEDSKQLAHDYVIDVNKKKGISDEPKFTG